MRVLHWAAALAIGAMLLQALPGAGMAQSAWLAIHLSLGAAIALVICLRLAARALTSPRSGRSALATITQAALYGSMIAVLLTGWVAYKPPPFVPTPEVMGVAEFPVFPWRTALPSWPYALLHRVTVWCFLALALLHVAGALSHAIKRDRVVASMMFGRPSRK